MSLRNIKINLGTSGHHVSYNAFEVEAVAGRARCGFGPARRRKVGFIGTPAEVQKLRRLLEAARRHSANTEAFFEYAKGLQGAFAQWKSRRN